MDISLRNPNDLTELDRRVRVERNAKQRDRYRAVRLAIAGQPTGTIMDKLGRSKNFVHRWCYAYRDRGIGAVTEKPRPGRPTKLPREQEEAFRQRMLAGPTAADGGVCTLRGKEAVRILEEQFGVQYSLDGAYDLLHRLGFSCLKPRPKHRKNDPQAMKQWLEDAPLLSRVYARSTPTNRLKSGSKMKRGLASRAS